MNETPILPVTDILRPVRLRTDVDLPGIHTLSLVGDNAFRVWRSQAPSTNDAPLLVSGQTATNGVDGVSWNTTSTDHVYVEAVANGTATLMYRYTGTGAAAGIVCRASLKMTAADVRLGLMWETTNKVNQIFNPTRKDDSTGNEAVMEVVEDESYAAPRNNLYVVGNPDDGKFRVSLDLDIRPVEKRSRFVCAAYDGEDKVAGSDAPVPAGDDVPVEMKIPGPGDEQTVTYGIRVGFDMDGDGTLSAEEPVWPMEVYRRQSDNSPRYATLRGISKEMYEAHYGDIDGFVHFLGQTTPSLITPNARSFLALCPPSAGCQYRLRHGQSAINGVLTDLTRRQAGEYIATETNTYGLARNQHAHSATAVDITSSGVEIPPAFLERIAQDADKGVILLEGRERVDAEPIRLEVLKSGQKVFESRLALSVLPVEERMDRINLRTSPPGIVSGSGASSSNGKHVIFLHGYKVDEAESVAWGAEIYKRLWQSGSNAEFHNVDWNGNEGVSNGALDYHGNVANALDASPALRTHVNSLGGEKILMAHSLGNMVVSAATGKYGMDADKYFMLNAAVAAEACDSGLFDETPGNVMVHEDWQNFTNTWWSAKYHELFAGTGDGRRNLTWKNFFANMLAFATVYNVWSSGDEVLELHGGTPYSTTGVFDSMGRYSWHKQEIHKGRGALDPAGTSWAGWGIEDPSCTFLNPLSYTNQPPTQVVASMSGMRKECLFQQRPTQTVLFRLRGHALGI